MTGHAAPAAPGREEFLWRSETGLPIRGELLTPPADRHPSRDILGGVVICHGFKGFYRWGFFPFLAEALAEAGFRVIVFNFSGSGVGPDGETFTAEDAFFSNTYTRELADLSLVVREATSRGWLGERFGLFGHSRGGGMAILYAAREARVAALVTWAAIATVARWPAEQVREWRERGFIDVPNVRTGQILRLGRSLLDEVDRLQHDELDILGAARRVSVPWLIVHGTNDESVPVDDARALHAAREARGELALINGAGHTFDIRHPMSAPSPALEHAIGRSVDFYRRALAP